MVGLRPTNIYTGVEKENFTTLVGRRPTNVVKFYYSLGEKYWSAFGRPIFFFTKKGIAITNFIFLPKFGRKIIKHNIMLKFHDRMDVQISVFPSEARTGPGVNWGPIGWG